MAWFSSFSPFGMLRFSSEKTQAEKAYSALKNSYGPSFSDGPVGEARLYANAMALGVAQCELDRAAGQFTSDRIYEMIPGKEAELGIVPAPDANLKTRRAGIAAAKLLRNGARYDAMVDGLRDILGSSFVAYYVNNAVANPITPVPSDPLSSGTYKAPIATPIQVVTLDSVVMPNALPQTVHYTHLCGENTPLKAGDTLAVDPAINGICEAITLLAADASTFSAIFVNPHDAKTPATTAPFENQSSWQRHVLVIVTAASITNVDLMQKIDNYMRRWGRIVSTYDVVVDDGSGHSTTTFVPGTGIPGHTTTTAVTY